MLKKTVFARLAGDRTVMALPDSILGVLPKSPLSYRDRTILAVDPGRVSRLTVARAEGTYTLVAADDPGKPPRWRMSAPVEGPADDESVARVLGMLAPLRAERLVAEERRGRQGVRPRCARPQRDLVVTPRGGRGAR